MKRNLMGTLLTAFRLERNKVRENSEEELWERNKMANPKLRAGYEIREKVIHTRDGDQVIEMELWGRVDSIATKIHADIKKEKIEVSEGESIEELMNEG